MKTTTPQKSASKKMPPVEAWSRLTKHCLNGMAVVTSEDPTGASAAH